LHTSDSNCRTSQFWDSNHRLRKNRPQNVGLLISITLRVFSPFCSIPLCICHLNGRFALLMFCCATRTYVTWFVTHAAKGGSVSSYVRDITSHLASCDLQLARRPSGNIIACVSRAQGPASRKSCLDAARRSRLGIQAACMAASTNSTTLLASRDCELVVF
jgi:hypothetical protein